MNAPTKHSHMSSEDVDAYLVKMANEPSSRPNGLEGKAFEAMDAAAKRRQELMRDMEAKGKELERLAEEGKMLDGEISGLVNLVVGAENERRAESKG